MKKAPLLSLKCVACEGEIPRLKPSEVRACLRALTGWKAKSGSITKSFPFKNYYETAAFVNAVVRIAHKENHHPEISFGYKQCKVVYSTHSVKGLTLNDFICASKVDAVFQGKAK